MTKATDNSRPSWRQVIISVAEEASPLVQEALLEEGALGLEIDDDETRAVPEKPFFPTLRARVVATFEPAEDLETRINMRLQELVKEDEIEWRDLMDGDWVDAFHKSWRSFSLGHDIWIVPSWEASTFQPKNPNALILYMDPGMAFGTGHHETTTLCARGLFERLKLNANPQSLHVLDVGTGTGILAMIAAKLGAGRVVATDNDPQALVVAIENCRQNGLLNQIELTDQAPDFDGPTFHLIVANILALPLIEMAAEIDGALTKGGTLLLSGILATQELDVRQAYENRGLIYQNTERDNEWVLIAFTKP